LVVYYLFIFFGRLDKLNLEIKYKMKNKYRNITAALLMASVSFSLSSCGGGADDANSAEDVEKAIEDITKKVVEEPQKPEDNLTLRIGGKFFTIPSPVQTAFLIKEEGSAFNSELLNKAENGDTYTTSFKKALNMGIYGADMGYITLYENTDLSLKYLKAVRKIAGELDLAGAFNDKLAERFSSNMENQDSMLVFVNEAYKNADDYLKNNDKSNIAALVVVGGWVEAVYFASQSAVETKNQKLINRVAEQKQALTNLIAMLKSLEGYTEVEEYEDLTIELEDLLTHFEGINFKYEYVEPVTDPVKKVTNINSKNTIEISDETLTKIVEGVKEIRNSMIG
jgi:hypothetical protein